MPDTDAPIPASSPPEARSESGPNFEKLKAKLRELFELDKAYLAAGELPLDDQPEEAVVHFKLVEGDTEKDNRKPDAKTTRAFVIDPDQPFVVSDSLSPTRGEGDSGNPLCIRFRYREHPSERNLQDKLNADTMKTLGDSLPARWKGLLFAADPTRTTCTTRSISSRKPSSASCST